MGMLGQEDWQEAQWIGSSEIFGKAENDVVQLSHWIWHPGVREANRNVFFRREIQLDTTTAFIRLDITSYTRYLLRVNGKVIGDVNRDWNTPTTAHYQLHPNRNLVAGKNVIAIQASSREDQGALACGIKLVPGGGGDAEILDPLAWICSDRAENNWYAPIITRKAGLERSAWPGTGSLHLGKWTGIRPWPAPCCGKRSRSTER